MTSERDLLTDDLLGSRFFEGPKTRTSRELPLLKNRTGMLERTASIVWEAMLAGGFDSHEFVLWNAHAWHPHHPGNRLTNRRPSKQEVAHGFPVLEALLEVYPDRPVLAIGEVCQRALASRDINKLEVRHPSFGGATIFRERVAKLKAEI